MERMNAVPGCRRMLPLFAALAMATGISSLAGTAAAQSADTVVEVGPNLVQSILNQLNTYMGRIQQATQYARDNGYWLRVLKEYNDALVKVGGIVNGFGLPPGARLERVGEDYLVAETCGVTGVDIAGLSTGFAVDAAGDWKHQQLQVCVNIRMMRNRKYNDSVGFLTDTLPSMLESLDDIEGLRNTGGRRGDIDAANSDSLRTANDLAVRAQEWQARMQAYDAYIEAMESNQKAIAQVALKGRPLSLAADLARTTALKAALDAD